MSSKRLFILLLLGVSITAAQGANLLTNGKFTTGDLTGWTITLANQNDLAEVRTDITYDGSPCLFLQSRSGIWEGALVSQVLDVNGLETVYFSCVVNKWTWGDLRVDLNWYTGPYDPCDPNVNWSSWEEWIVIENADETTDWDSFSNTFTVPEGAVNVVFGLRANDWVWNVYVDDVFFGTPVTGQATLVSPALGGWVPEEDKSNCGYGPTLQWEAAEDATGDHHVYFGTSFEDVNDANENDPEYKGSVPLATTSYVLSLDDVEKSQTYYWRVDETTSGGVVKAQAIWQFSVWNLTWIDTFDNYLDNADIQSVWGTNAYLYDQTMEIYYNGTAYEVSADADDLLCSSDVSANSMIVLLVAGHDNMSDNIYLEIESNDGAQSGVVQYPDSRALNQQSYESFITWPIDLQEFTSQGVDLTNVTKITIGIGTGSGPSGSGTIYIDDIRLDYPYCIAELIPADFDNNCWVGMDELEMLANDWLAESYTVTAAAPSQGPILWLKCDEGSGYDPLDSSGNEYDGFINDLSAWGGPGTGHDGTDCLDLDNAAWVEIPVAVNNDHNTIGEESTVSWWLNDPGQSDDDSMIVQIGVDGRTINMWSGATGSFYYKVGYDPNTGYRDELNIGSMDYTNPEHPQDQWVHYAFVKSLSNGYVRAYRNGELIAEEAAAVFGTPLLDEIEGYATLGGWRWSGDTGGYYDGLIDDFRIYDYALSHEEVLYLAVEGGAATSPLTQGLLTPSDATGDDVVNFTDLAKIGEYWLQDVVWP